MRDPQRDRIAAAFDRELARSPLPPELRAQAVHGAARDLNSYERQGPPRMLVLVAALLALAIVATLVFTARSLQSRQVVPANPGPLPKAGALAPGTYFLANPDPICAGGCASYQRIIFTLPAGWATSNGLVYKHLDQPNEVAFSAWTVDQVYADPCHWQKSALSPLDLTNHSHAANGAIVLAPYDGGLANQALRGPLPHALIPVTLGGVLALRIDLSVPAGLDISTCDKGQFRSWSEWHVANGANSHNARGQLDSVYMVDVDRRPLVIDASHMPATSPADLAELKAVLASMIVDRGGPVATPSPAPLAGSSGALVGLSGAAVVQGAVLNPGTYDYVGVEGTNFNVRFTVPAGWTWNGGYLSKGGVGLPHGAAIFFDGRLVQVYSDPCQWAGTRPVPPTGSSVHDLIAALAAQPMRNATTPIQRNANVPGFGGSPGIAGRWPGMAVELTVPNDIVFADCYRGEFRSWGPDGDARSHQGPGQRDLVWAVDLTGNGVDAGGQRLIIDAASFPGTPADVMSEIEAILGSIAVGHWG